MVTRRRDKSGLKQRLLLRFPRPDERVRDREIGFKRESGPSIRGVKQLLNGIPGGALSLVAFEKTLFGQLASSNVLQSVDDFLDPIRKGLSHAFEEY